MLWLIPFSRLALIALIGWLLAGEPQILSPRPKKEREIQLGAPQTIQTTDERVCMHSRTTDEVAEETIQKTFIMLREMGAAQVVEYLPWAYVERQAGVYDWSHPDRILKHIENQGLKPIIRLGFVPDWLRPDEDSQFTNANYITSEGIGYFARFVGAFAERYAGRVDKIIIWNEPNLNIEWTNGGADPIAYTDMLRQTYQAAKAANPEIIILGGALAPTNEPPRSAAGWHDIDFLRQLYMAGAGDYFDALAAHVYGFDQPPQAEPAPDALNFRRVELLREVMLENGDGHKLIYITEGGWNDHPRWLYGVRPGQRIIYTLEAYRYSRENMPWLAAFCLWAFRYPVHTNSYPDYFTYVAQNFAPKPIYTALQAYARGWDAPAWLPEP